MQATVAQIVPAPPAPPQAPAAANYSVGELQGRPVTQADVDALKAKRSELSRQLNSAQERRDEAAKSLLESPGGQSRVGIEQRLEVLDGRLVQLEQDIAANGRQLAAAPSALLATSTAEASSPARGQPSARQWTAMTIVFTVMVLCPLALAYGRAILRRSSIPKPSPQILENTQRLERMEQAIDSIAIEIERVTEGQRFVTQLMAKRAEPAALAVGDAPAEPIVVKQPEPVSFERR